MNFCTTVSVIHSNEVSISVASSRAHSMGQSHDLSDKNIKKRHQLDTGTLREKVRWLLIPPPHTTHQCTEHLLLPTYGSVDSSHLSEYCKVSDSSNTMHRCSFEMNCRRERLATHLPRCAHANITMTNYSKFKMLNLGLSDPGPEKPPNSIVSANFSWLQNFTSEQATMTTLRLRPRRKKTEQRVYVTTLQLDNTKSLSY